MSLEITGEVLGVFEAEGVGDLGDGETADQQALGTVDKKALDDLRGTLAGDVRSSLPTLAGIAIAGRPVDGRHPEIVGDRTAGRSRTPAGYSPAGCGRSAATDHGAE